MMRMPTENLIVIHSDETKRTRLQRELTAVGYTVFAAATAMEGLEHVIRQQPSMLLLGAPLDGEVTAMRLLSDLREADIPEFQMLPVVFLENNLSEIELHRAKKYGVKHFLANTATLEELLFVLQYEHELVLDHEPPHYLELAEDPATLQ